MSFVLFKDSFSRYDVGVASAGSALLDNFLSRYTTVGGVPELIASGRNGQALRLGTASAGKTLAHSARWVVGFAFRLNQPQLVNQSIYELANNLNQMCRLLQDADGTLQIRAGNSNVIAVTTRPINVGRWYFIELDMTVGGGSPLTMTAELRINGHVEASGNGSTGFNATDQLSYASTGGVDANYHTFSGPTGVGNSDDFDDVYIKNEAGYEGDIRNSAVFPSGDGGTLQWTPNSGSTHFDRVNTHPVDLTKWLETATPGDIDLWTFVLPSFSGSIVAVNISVLARKDDEGTKSFKIVVGPTGTDALSDEFFVSDVTPEYYEFSLKQDPTTAADWAPGATITVGVKLIS